MLSEHAILEHYAGWDLVPAEREYLAYHARRLAYTLGVVEGCVARTCGTKDGPVTLLDIGPHFLTDLLRHCFPGATLNTLGYRNPRCYRADLIHDHLPFDLNETRHRERWPRFHEHDVIVMAEVIEHLPTAPAVVLEFLTGLLKPGGYLVVQTPNAVAVEKRLVMLRGANPFEMLRRPHEDPGHFREYTVHELRCLGEGAGLEVASWDVQNYFGPLPLSLRLLGNLRKTLRQGITVVYHKRHAASEAA